MLRHRFNRDQDHLVLNDGKDRVICSQQAAKKHIGKTVMRKCFTPPEARRLPIAHLTEGRSHPGIRFRRTRLWMIPQLCHQWHRTSQLLTFQYTSIKPPPQVSLFNRGVAHSVRRILVHQKAAFQINKAVILSQALQLQKVMLTWERPRTRFAGYIRTMSPSRVGTISATSTSIPTSLAWPLMRLVPLTYQASLLLLP